MPNMTYTSNFAMAKIAKIKVLLDKKAMCARELAVAVHTSQRNINGYLRFLKLFNFIYIANYKKVQCKSKQYNCAFYKFGFKPDAIKPKPQTAAEKGREKRARILADPELHDLLNAKRRARKIKPKADWTSTWIAR
jgi:hypothetical protein